MFAELIDALRCPRPHEDSWLVAFAERTEDRDIVAGTLGCPVCQAEYAIVDGVVRFAAAAPAPREAPSDETAMRLAAFLALTEPSMVAILAGSWGSHASAVRDVAPAQLLLLDPPTGAALGGGVSAIEAPGAVPLAPGAVHAAAVDAAHAAVMGEIVRVVKGGGRILAPTSLAVPPGVREIARDEVVWVGLVEGGTTAPVALKRR